MRRCARLLVEWCPRVAMLPWKAGSAPAWSELARMRNWPAMFFCCNSAAHPESTREVPTTRRPGCTTMLGTGA